MMLVQTVLQHKVPSKLDYKCYAEMTTWLPMDKRVRIGTVITLKDDERRIKWTVRSHGARMEARLINRRWNVGGL